MHWPQLMQLETFRPSSKAGADVRVGAAADEVDGRHALDLLAHPHALAAEDALGRVADDRGAGRRRAVPACARRSSAARRRPAPRPAPAAGSCRCARSRGSRRGGWPAAARRSSCRASHRARRVRLDLHAARDREGAATGPGRAGPRPRPRTCGRRRVGRQALDVAERRHVDARRAAAAASSVSPSWRLDRPAVDFDVSSRQSSLVCVRPGSVAYATSTASKRQTSTQVPQPMHLSAMMWCGLFGAPTIASDGHLLRAQRAALALARCRCGRSAAPCTPPPGSRRS